MLLFISIFAAGPHSESKVVTSVFILEVVGFYTDSCINEGPVFYSDHLISQGPMFAAHWMAEKLIALPRPDLSAVTREIGGHPSYFEVRLSCWAGALRAIRVPLQTGSLEHLRSVWGGPWEGGHWAELGLPFWAKGRGKASRDVYTC